MNNSTSTSLDYVEALPLAAEQKAGLRDQLRGQGDVTPDAVHHALNDGSRPQGEMLAAEDAALGSVTRRLHMAWPQTARHPDLLVQDSRGRTAIKAMPTIKRTTMFPEPWFTNPLVRFWGVLRGKSRKPRHKQEMAAREDGNWRTVGTVRRYILLALTLFQTAIATWYMKTILPYQGWALIDPMDMIHQDVLQSVLQLLPYVLQSGILILVRHPVLLGVGRLLDRADGLLAVVDWP